MTETPTLLTEEVHLLEPDKPYVVAGWPRPFTVTKPGYYTAYVSDRHHFIVQRIDITKPLVRC